MSDRDAAVDFAALDLSGAELRSVSPHHLEFIRNMGQASTISFSLIRDGVLVADDHVCSPHEPADAVPAAAGLEVLASQVALQLNLTTQLDQLVCQQTARGIRVALIDQ